MKTRAKRSRVWKVSKAELEAVVKAAATFSEILRYFKLGIAGGNHKTLKARLAADGIDYSHIKEGLGASRGRRFAGTKKPLQEILIKGSTYSRGHLKRRLIEEGVLKNECAECGMGPTWQNKPLVLVLDHKNGTPDDYRKQNLRLLCPNCNSQTETFCGRKVKSCPGCRGRFCGTGKHCDRACYAEALRGAPKVDRRKVTRPTVKALLADVKALGYSATGRKYGVSDNAIRKWIEIGE